MDNEKQPASYQISEDGLTVTVYSTAGEPQVFSVEHIEKTIRYFGAIRAQMKPVVSMDVDTIGRMSHHPVTHLFLQNIAADQSPVEAGCRILARSPEFGWLAYVAPPSFCSDMREWLEANPAESQASSGKHLN